MLNLPVQRKWKISNTGNFKKTHKVSTTGVLCMCHGENKRCQSSPFLRQKSWENFHVSKLVDQNESRISKSLYVNFLSCSCLIYFFECTLTVAGGSASWKRFWSWNVPSATSLNPECKPEPRGKCTCLSTRSSLREFTAQMKHLLALNSYLHYAEICVLTRLILELLWLGLMTWVDRSCPRNSPWFRMVCQNFGFATIFV